MTELGLEKWALSSRDILNKTPEFRAPYATKTTVKIKRSARLDNCPIFMRGDDRRGAGF